MNTDIKSKFKNMFESKILKKIIYTFGVVIIAFLIFQAGVFIGFHRVSFSHDWSNNYADNFGPSKNDGPRMMDSGWNDWRDLPNAHGAIGRIIKTELPTIIVMDDKDKIEKNILITDDTDIVKMRDKIKKESLSVDDFVVIIGSPNNQGQIEAKLIRLMPSPLLVKPLNKDITPKQ